MPKPIFTNEREDFVVTFYNGEYPELYPEELINDKKTQNLNKILEICKEAKSITEIMEALGYKSNKTLKRNYIKYDKIEKEIINKENKCRKIRRKNLWQVIQYIKYMQN